MRMTTRYCIYCDRLTPHAIHGNRRECACGTVYVVMGDVTHADARNRNPDYKPPPRLETPNWLRELTMAWRSENPIGEEPWKKGTGRLPRKFIEKWERRRRKLLRDKRKPSTEES